MATKWEGEQVKFYPYKKRGTKSLSRAEGGVTTSYKVVLTQELEILAILTGGGVGGGAKSASTCRLGLRLFKKKKKRYVITMAMKL